MDIDTILQSIERNAIEIVRFEQTSVHGMALSREIPARHFRKKAEDGVFFPINRFCRDPKAKPISTIVKKYGTGDVLCLPDLDTFVVLPWCENTGRILLEPATPGNPLLCHPRTVARRQLDQLQEIGYSLFSTHEMEFSLIHRDSKTPVNYDGRSNATLRNNQDMKFTYQVNRQLPKVGVDIECLESELGPGQTEYTYAPAFGLRAADNAHTFKMSVKEIALQHDYIATFMTLPFEEDANVETNYNPNNIHFNHSLWDVEGKVPLLYDPNETNCISQVGQHWIAGLIEHGPAITALMSPTINCMKLISRDFPTDAIVRAATWGIDNRAALLRVKVNGPKGTYFENRLGGSLSNPYITLAATVAAGLDGIKRELPLPKPVIGFDRPPGTVLVPTNMKEAVRVFLDDTIITESLGKEFTDHFVACKAHEMKLEEEAKAKGDTNWERDLYLEYI